MSTTTSERICECGHDAARHEPVEPSYNPCNVLSCICDDWSQKQQTTSNPSGTAAGCSVCGYHANAIVHNPDSGDIYDHPFQLALPPDTPTAAEAREEWRVEFQPDKKYPDLGEYRILEPNPDAGKSGVPFAGRELVVAWTDSKDVAVQVIAEHNTHARLVAALRDLLKMVEGGDWTTEELDAAHAALAAVDERG